MRIIGVNVKILNTLNLGMTDLKSVYSGTVNLAA